MPPNTFSQLPPHLLSATRGGTPTHLRYNQTRTAGADPSPICAQPRPAATGRGVP